jgi:hypothetical protein
LPTDKTAVVLVTPWIYPKFTVLRCNGVQPATRWNVPEKRAGKMIKIFDGA